MPRRKKAPLIPETQKNTVIPKDLQDKVSALRALVGTQKLLNEYGSFPYQYRDQVKVSLDFLQALHEPLFKEAQNHECAHMIEGLKPETKKPEVVPDAQA